MDFSFFQSPQGVAVAFASMLAGSLAVMGLRHRLEEKRKIWGDVAQKLAAIGLAHLAAIFQCLSVGDLSGAARAAYDLWKILHDPAQRAVALKDAGKKILQDLYQDPNHRQEIDDYIQQLRDLHLPDKKSDLEAAVNELADQKTLVEALKADVASLKSKISADVSKLTSA